MRFTLLFLATYAVLQHATAFGEMKCSQDVSFKIAPAGASVKAEPPKEGEGAAADGVRTVFFSSIEAQAENEDAAKEALKKKNPMEKERALAQCRSSYENNAGCIASKYAAMNSVLHTLDFKARSELQKAIQHDCAMQTGKCLEAVVTEAACKEVVKAAEEAKPESAEAAKAAEGGKDKKADKGGGKKK